MSLHEAIWTFIANYWQGLLAFAALIAALFGLYLQRLSINREHLAHYIEFGPLPEEIQLSGDKEAPKLQIKLINDTGLPQIVRDLWLRIVKYPAEISDEQADNLWNFTSALKDSIRVWLSSSKGKRFFSELAERPELAEHWLPRAMGFGLGVYDKVTKGKIVVSGPRRILDSWIGLMRDGLSTPKDMTKEAARTAMKSTYPVLEFMQRIIPNENLPITKSLDLEIQPKGVRTTTVDLTDFKKRCENAFQLIGGEGRFTCIIEARVHRSNDWSKSGLFDIVISIPLMDWSPIIASVQKEFDNIMSSSKE